MEIGLWIFSEFLKISGWRIFAWAFSFFFSNFFLEIFFFVICSYSVGYIISEVSSSIICISGWVIQIHEIHHTFQANRPKPFWWCILELKLPLGLMECHHGVIWPWFDSTDQNNRQQMSHLEYWNQILVHPFSSSRTHGFRITSKLNITSCVNARPGWGAIGPTSQSTADPWPGQRSYWYSIYSGQYFTVLLSDKQNSKSNWMF